MYYFSSDEGILPPSFDAEMRERAQYLFEWNETTKDRATKVKEALGHLKTLVKDRRLVSNRIIYYFCLTLST